MKFPRMPPPFPLLLPVQLLDTFDEAITTDVSIDVILFNVGWKTSGYALELCPGGLDVEMGSKEVAFHPESSWFESSSGCAVDALTAGNVASITHDSLPLELDGFLSTQSFVFKNPGTTDVFTISSVGGLLVL